MLFMMLEITTQGLFYGTGRTIPPAVISIGFNTLRIPLAMLLASIGMEITGVWWAISLTSIAKGITSAAWFAVLKRRILVTKGDDD
jgi:Na+-driven multidrug efflux pump